MKLLINVCLWGGCKARGATKEKEVYPIGPEGNMQIYQLQLSIVK